VLGAEIDIPNLSGLGIGAVVLTLVFRTLWQQNDGWKSVLAGAIEEAKVARAEADAAREESRAAREDAGRAREAANHAREEAAAARLESVESRATESESRRLLAEFHARMDRYERQVGTLPPTDGTAAQPEV